MAPSAAYADPPPGIGFEPKDEPPWRNLLGRMFGRTLIEHVRIGEMPEAMESPDTRKIGVLGRHPRLH
jgi:hypothetical protein